MDIKLLNDIDQMLMKVGTGQTINPIQLKQLQFRVQQAIMSQDRNGLAQPYDLKKS